MDMARRLILLRHAKSDWNDEHLGDFDRALTDRGRRDAPAVGRFLHGAGYRIDYVISSPARRAWETALAVCEESRIPDANIQWRSDLYLASLDDLLDVLAQVQAEARNVLLVGHNPGLEDLLTHLVDRAQLRQHSHDGKLMPTAAAAVLDMPEDWKKLPPHCAKLDKLLRPRSLEEN
jgi:phosphohistidine phosphatase